MERLQAGLKALKAGDKAAAYNLLQSFLEDYPDNEQGWFALYSASQTLEDRRRCLENILRINPNHTKAREIYLKLKRQKSTARRGNPAMLVIIGIGLLTVLIGAAVVLLGPALSPETPPVPTLIGVAPTATSTNAVEIASTTADSINALPTQNTSETPIPIVATIATPETPALGLSANAGVIVGGQGYITANSLIVSDSAQIDVVESAVVGLGGIVLQRLNGVALRAQIPNGSVDAVRAVPGVVEVYQGVIPDAQIAASGDAGQAMALWNAMVGGSTVYQFEADDLAVLLENQRAFEQQNPPAVESERVFPSGVGDAVDAMNRIPTSANLGAASNNIFAPIGQTVGQCAGEYGLPPRQWWQTSEYALGSTLVDVVFVQPEGYTWDSATSLNMLAQITNGLEWWQQVGFRDAAGNPTLIWDIRQRTVSTRYDPWALPAYNSTNGDDESAWVSDVITQMALQDGLSLNFEQFGTASERVQALSDSAEFTYLNRARFFAHQRRCQTGHDWGVVIFVVPDTGGERQLEDHAVWNGPMMVLTTAGINDWNADTVSVCINAPCPMPRYLQTAHEIGHIFGADDEYTGCDSTRSFGYLNMPNTACSSNTSPSLMGVGSAQLEAWHLGLSNPQARGQIFTPSALAALGWQVRNPRTDALIPPVAGTFTHSGIGSEASYNLNPNAQTLSEITGSAGVIYPCQAMTSCEGGQIGAWQGDASVSALGFAPLSINMISQVEYRLNGGAWQTATCAENAEPADVVNYPAELRCSQWYPYDLPFDGGQPGNYTLELRLTDRWGWEHTLDSVRFRLENALPTATPLPRLESVIGRLVFVSTRDGNQEIYGINGDGTGLTQLTNHPADDFAPVWSPDGQQIAFISKRESAGDLYVMSADGANVRRLTNLNGSTRLPVWSPDGQFILLGGNGNIGCSVSCASDIIRVEVASGTQQPLTSTPGSESVASWLPDGAHMVVESLCEGCPQPDYQLLNITGSDGIALTDRLIAGFMLADSRPGATGVRRDFQWSPDDNWVVIDGDSENGSRDLFVYPTNQQPGRNLTQSSGETDYSPRWSPDGRQLAYIASQGTNSTVMVWTPETDSISRVLTVESSQVNAPAWSPDGEEVVVSAAPGCAGANCPTDLYVVRVDTPNQSTNLTRGASSNSGANWTAHGRFAGGSSAIQPIPVSGDLATFSFTRRMTMGYADTVAVSAALRQVAGAGNTTLIVKAIDSGETVFSYTDPQANPFVLIQYSPGGRLLFTAQADGSVRAWGAAEGYRPLWEAEIGQAVNYMTVNGSGQLVVAGSSLVRLINLGDGSTLREWAWQSTGKPALTPDGVYLIAPRTRFTAGIWEMSSGRMVRELSISNPNTAEDISGDTLGGVMVNHDGRVIIGVDARHARAWIWNFASGQQISWLNKPFMGTVGEVGLFDPFNGGWIRTTNAGTLLFNLFYTEDIYQQLPEAERATCVAVSPGGSLLAVCDRIFETDRFVDTVVIYTRQGAVEPVGGQ